MKVKEPLGYRIKCNFHGFQWNAFISRLFHAHRAIYRNKRNVRYSWPFMIWDVIVSSVIYKVTPFYQLPFYHDKYKTYFGTHHIKWAKTLFHLNPLPSASNDIAAINIWCLAVAGSLFAAIVDTSFQEFVNSPCMTEIKERSCFIHIDVPGHGDNADTLPDS